MAGILNVVLTLDRSGQEVMRHVESNHFCDLKSHVSRKRPRQAIGKMQMPPPRWRMR